MMTLVAAVSLGGPDKNMEKERRMRAAKEVGVLPYLSSPEVDGGYGEGGFGGPLDEGIL
jgi:hypothetical protein